MPVYERRVGDHAAERLLVPADSDEDRHYADLVAAGEGNWLLVEVVEPQESEKEEPKQAPKPAAPRRRGRPPGSTTKKTS